MPEEDLEAQNAGEGTPEPAQPEGGEQKTDQPAEAPAEPDEKEEKKERDFEKGMYKWREKARALETEIKALRQPAAPEPTGEEEEQAQKEAVKLLRNVIAEELKPVTTRLEASERDKAIEEVGKMPYAGDFTDEIFEKVKALPDNMSFSERLKRGYNDTIAENISNIISNNREAGKEEAYDNQAGKKQPVMGGEPSKSGGEEEKSLLERYKAGELTPQEYLEHRDEIDKLRKAELGI